MTEPRLIALRSGITLAVALFGPADGPPLLLLHGFPEGRFGWRAQVERLAARGFRVIAPDLRGYGESDAPAGIGTYRADRIAGDVIALADALGLRGFALVGHDWGGVIAWIVAARAAARVRRLVIMAAPHPDTMRGALRRDPVQLLRSLYIAFFQVPALPERMLSAGNFSLLRRALRRSARPGTFPARDLDRYAADWRRPGRLTAMLNWYRALRLGGRPLGRVSVPTLILWGARDRFLGSALATAAAAMCDQVEVEVRADATHWLHIEDADWAAARIGDFCGGSGG